MKVSLIWFTKWIFSYRYRVWEEVQEWLAEFVLIGVYSISAVCLNPFSITEESLQYKTLSLHELSAVPTKNICFRSSLTRGA